ncbi:nitroreductase family protein [Methanolobus sediminis]|uniref:Nitroreductase family protein n=1 Tax=Methanolobus sediminis TaxID=3072978 RepID=A0AA51YJ00_9EURY|nr:nitroreductase family protein [Methanolobus sediminis]WMW25060.1 nitroreductase family protein [Methanolobus sediminis]
MDFNELTIARYASRKYTDRKIDEETIGQIKEMIRNSPSAVNVQPWMIKIIDDAETKEKLAPHVFGGQTQVPSCSHILILCANIEWDSHIQANIEGMRKAQVPEQNIKYYQMAVDGMFGRISDEERLVESQKNVYIAAAAAIFGAKSLGVDSCIIQGFDVDALSKVLDLPANLTPTLIVTLGYAADSPVPKSRLPEDEIFC